MKADFRSIIKKQPLFLLLLPVFFVLHGCQENYGLINTRDALLLMGIYLLGALVIFGIIFLFYRNRAQAGLIAFVLMFFNFFFGSLHDFLKRNFPGTFFSRYSFVLPISILLIIILAILIKRKRPALARTTHYLNLLFLLLIVIDVSLFAGKKIFGQQGSGAIPKDFTVCDTCSKPDIYIIIADEYAGEVFLSNILKFDNTTFRTELSERGFRILKNNHSNYLYTPYSMASFFKMDYLDLARKTKRRVNGLNYCYETIKNSNFFPFLEAHGYKIYNHSIFDLKGHPGHLHEGLLPINTQLLTEQTLTRRFERDVLPAILSSLHIKTGQSQKIMGPKRYNENTLIEIKKTIEEKTVSPKFVYIHLIMPHFPYYFDKTGFERPVDQLAGGHEKNLEWYISYLEYTNQKLLQLIDEILQKGSNSPVIFLLGDHGLKDTNTPVDDQYHLNNLAAILMPDKNYSTFRDSSTNVNLLRTFLNKQFGQNLTLLKDSLIY